MAYNGVERREHFCKFEDKINEMHGDLKVLVSEFKSMNGALRETKRNFELHNDESIPYRKKIDIVWAMMHCVKWAVGLLIASGVLIKIIKIITKYL